MSLGRFKHRWRDNIKMYFKTKRVLGCGLDPCGTTEGLVHRLVFRQNTTFRKLDKFPSSGERIGRGFVLSWVC
jgi:hypothetical protein